jgi:hypothetical protein
MSKLIILRDYHDLKAEEDERVALANALKIDNEGMNPSGRRNFAVVGITGDQAEKIRRRLGPTLWADYSFKVGDFAEAHPFEPDKILYVGINRRAA